MSGPDFGTTTCARPPALAAGARVLPDAPVTARGVGCATLRERPGSCVNDQVMPAPTDGLRFGDDRQSTRTVSSPTPSGLPGQRGWLGKRLSLAQTSKENKGARSVRLRAPRLKPSDLTRQGRPITGSKTVASEVRQEDRILIAARSSLCRPLPHEIDCRDAHRSRSAADEKRSLLSRASLKLQIARTGPRSVFSRIPELRRDKRDSGDFDHVAPVMMTENPRFHAGRGRHRYQIVAIRAECRRQLVQAVDWVAGGRVRHVMRDDKGRPLVGLGQLGGQPRPRKPMLGQSILGKKETVAAPNEAMIVKVAFGDSRGLLVGTGDGVIGP